MSRPVVDCCEPQMLPFPSGWSWAHASDCEVARKQKIATPPHATPAQVRHERAVQAGEDSRAAVTTIPWRGAVHPACKAAVADGATPCSECAWRMGLDTPGARYVDYWADAR